MYRSGLSSQATRTDVKFGYSLPEKGVNGPFIFGMAFGFVRLRSFVTIKAGPQYTTRSKRRVVGVVFDGGNDRVSTRFHYKSDFPKFLECMMEILHGFHRAEPVHRLSFLSFTQRQKYSICNCLNFIQ
jgi:hypothetical protein